MQQNKWHLQQYAYTNAQTVKISPNTHLHESGTSMFIYKCEDDNRYFLNAVVSEQLPKYFFATMFKHFANSLMLNLRAADS